MEKVSDIRTRDFHTSWISARVTTSVSPVVVQGWRCYQIILLPLQSHRPFIQKIHIFLYMFTFIHAHVALCNRYWTFLRYLFSIVEVLTSVIILLPLQSYRPFIQKNAHFSSTCSLSTTLNVALCNRYWISHRHFFSIVEVLTLHSSMVLLPAHCLKCMWRIKTFRSRVCTIQPLNIRHHTSIHTP